MCQECGCHSHEETAITLSVDGMSCDHCKKAVEKALAAVDGLYHINVNLEDNTVSFYLPHEGDNTLVSKAKSAIIAAGFSL